MAYRLGAVVLSLLVIGVASAAPPTPDTAGVGGVTCAVFGKEYGNNPEYADAIWFSWLQGYRDLELSTFAVVQLAKMLRDFKDQYYKRWHGELTGAS
jgi:hypothetical protein